MNLRSVAKTPLGELLTASMERALRGESKLPPEVLELSGYSSARMRHLLNNLCSPTETTYLEIGTWKGSTLVSASFANSGRFTGIDNFSQFRYRQLRSPRAVLRKVAARFERQCRFEFHEADCWEIELSRLPQPVNVFFYDGEHDEESQRRAFVRFDPILADEVVVLVDDWNWAPVRDGTRAAFRELCYTPVLEYECFTRRNRSKKDWWNGVYVAVVRRVGS